MPNIVFALRRIWIGQSSGSEHGRAVGMSKEKMNQPWCFNKVSGKPNKNKYGFRWRKDFPEKERKTIFYINIIHN